MNTDTGQIDSVNTTAFMRPDAVATYFVLWRITHDQKYRTWAWNYAQALHKRCKHKHGYACNDDHVEYWWFSSTLKVNWAIILVDRLVQWYVLCVCSICT